LVVAGGNVKDALYEEKLKSMAPEGTIFIGHIDQHRLESLTKYCRAFVLPSVLEGMSNSLLVAMSLSKAVLVADIPENRDVVTTDSALFKADDLLALQKGLARLSHDVGFSKSLGSTLAYIAQQKYSWDSTVDGFYNLILRIK